MKGISLEVFSLSSPIQGRGGSVYLLCYIQEGKKKLSAFIYSGVF